MVIRVGTRKSPLAMYQAKHVVNLLAEIEPTAEFEIIGIDSKGDLDQSESLFKIGGQGIFVNTIRQALVERRVDIVVHSAKDIPGGTIENITIGAYPLRADVRDVLIGKSLSQLTPGDIVRTGSARRMLQMAVSIPGLLFEELRGNIATRMSKIPSGGSIIVAKAALDRLNIVPENSEVLSTEVMLPQIGQGAIAVETEASNVGLLELLSEINNRETSDALTIERGFLNAVGSDCSWPVGGWARYDGNDHVFEFIAMLGNLERNLIIRTKFSVSESSDLDSFGATCAVELMDLAKSQGF